MRPKGLCYLSGVDWTFYTLDYLSKKSTGCGIASQAILCLNRPLDMDQIKKRLSSFIRLFPVIHGKCARAWNLAPYWSYLENTTEGIPVISETAASDDEAVAFLHACVNQPFVHEREHLRFVQVIVGAHAYVSLVFDHRLLDARGAQNFKIVSSILLWNVYLISTVLAGTAVWAFALEREVYGGSAGESPVSGTFLQCPVPAFADSQGTQRQKVSLSNNSV